MRACACVALTHGGVLREAIVRPDTGVVYMTEDHGGPLPLCA